MKFKVNFYTKHNTSMQTETVEASSQQEVFYVFAVNGCFDIEITEIDELPARNASQSSNYVKGSIQWDADIPHPIDEAYQLEKEIDTEIAEQDYRKSQLPANVTASGEWLKRNTHASPQEKEIAKANGEVLQKIRI